MPQTKRFVLFIVLLLTTASSSFAAMRCACELERSFVIPEGILNVVNNGTKRIRGDIIEVHFRLERKMLDLIFKTHFAELRDYWHRRGESALSCEELKRFTDALLMVILKLETAKKS